MSVDPDTEFDPVVAHVFVFAVEPSPGSPYDGQIGFAQADVWVIGRASSESEAIARAYVMEQSWLVTRLERRVEIAEADIHRYRPDAQALFRVAKARGISGAFVAAPLVDREDNTVEIHHMAPPHRSPGSIQ